MKSHHSMNLEELLKCDKLMQNDPSYYHNNNSSFFYERTSDNLNNNEVWSEINKQQKHVKDNNVRVIGDESNLIMASQSQHWLPFELQMPMPIPMSIPMQMPSIHVEQHQDLHHQQILGLCPNFNAAQSVYENKLMNIDYDGMPLAMPMPIGPTTMSVSSTCSDSQGVVASAASVGVGVEMIDKTVDRKQKRMAKNRESAAKSRAKKQEYINKLQMDKFRLEKINKELKMRKKIDEEFFSNLKPRYQLRRTSSAKF